MKRLIIHSRRSTEIPKLIGRHTTPIQRKPPGRSSSMSKKKDGKEGYQNGMRFCVIFFSLVLLVLIFYVITMGCIYNKKSNNSYN